MSVLDSLRETLGGGGLSKGGGQTETSPDLGLGGLKSLLGPRGPAEAGNFGDAQMQETLTDKLPGYFDPTSRESVPWYMDLVNGGGFNSSGSQNEVDQGGMLGAQKAISPESILPVQPNAYAGESYSPARQGLLSERGTVVPLDQILTGEEIARRDAERRMDLIKIRNYSFNDVANMSASDVANLSASGQSAQPNKQGPR